jgi:hypothetical protein
VLELTDDERALVLLYRQQRLAAKPLIHVGAEAARRQQTRKLGARHDERAGKKPGKDKN